VADKLALRPSEKSVPGGSHRLIKELGIPSEALLDLIEGTSRLKMAVRGWVAERHLAEILSKLPGVTDCQRIEGDGQPDLSLRWKGSAPIKIECKNVLRKRTAVGLPRVDFQKTRASKGDFCSRYYKPEEFAVLAACLHSVTEEWRFSFAVTAALPKHARCVGRISSNLVVEQPLFCEEPALVFDKCSI